MNRIFKYIFFLLLSASSVSAQEINDTLGVLDYTVKADYEIGSITVVGAPDRDRNAIKSIAALKEGDKIKIPGLVIPKAIKALMRLRLFDDVQVIQNKVDGEIVHLTIVLVERPTLARYSYTGIKKSKHDDLNDIVRNVLNKGGIVTDAAKELARVKLEQYFTDQGKLDSKVTVDEIEDEVKPNSVRLVFDIKESGRVKVQDITFIGNKEVSSRKLRKKMKNTKRRGTWFRKTKFIRDDYKEDKESIVAYYNSLGFRDAKIMSDSVWREEDGDVQALININEGNRYYFRNIAWKGNSLYTDDQLAAVLGIVKGDAYDPELLQNRLTYSLDGRDVSSLYMDDGYLFFDIKPTEVSVSNDSIDLEMRIYEGPQATINEVRITGNDRTHESVVRRTVRTRPGQKFSRSQIIRSQREIINLGYFNPENMDIQTPVNPQRGTVDIEYVLEERPSDQLELSAGYGGASGLIGTLGVTFNNFSLQNVRNKETWSPLPQGDGQKLSLRIQSNSRFFRSYNFSFTEPWLGGKKPNSFTVGAVHSAIDYSQFGQGALNITRIFAGLGTQLKFPDDFFSSSTTVNLETIKLNDYLNSVFQVKDDRGSFVTIRNGSFKNFSLNQTITRSSISDPLYPRRGSRVSLSLQLTPPWSAMGVGKSDPLTQTEIDDIITVADEENGPARKLSELEKANLISSVENANKFEWLEYHKWKFNTEWYFNVVDKLVFMTSIKMGFLGGYDDRGIPPFERFQLGGDGLSNQNSALTGTEVISLRGYETNEINNNRPAAIYDKFTVELRYPLSLNPSSTIYAKIFAQGGNAWDSFSDFNPFDMNRSVGGGLRVFLPMFGLLGFDYGIGFDKNLPASAEFGQYAKFNIVLGFEPE
ncbi:MAG: outer membrane protein insertion porin family [Saprospiraceae bacterium]|jgi:outer membrane protein insertion porin family